MANVVPYAFKQGILKGQHDLSQNNAYYLALYTTATPYAVTDSVYSSAVANQVGTSGTAYTTNGLAVLRCKLTYNKQRKDFSTGIRVNPDQWDPKKQ